MYQISITKEFRRTVYLTNKKGRNKGTLFAISINTHNDFRRNRRVELHFSYRALWTIENVKASLCIIASTVCKDFKLGWIMMVGTEKQAVWLVD